MSISLPLQQTWPSDSKYKLQDNRVTSRVVFHKFNVGDSEDPDLYAAEPLYVWEQSEQGQWCKEHVVGDITWIRQIDYQTLSFMYVIYGYLDDEDHTFFKLKWG